MTAEPSKAAARLRVLVVDDDRDCADSTALLLRQLGHESHSVSDAMSALSDAVAFRPQLILLDLAMPGKDGFALARDLRNINGLSELPIVALTGYADNRHRDAAGWARFDGYLVKPCGLNDLQLILRTIEASFDERP